jgi:hypothetical protein
VEERCNIHMAGLWPINANRNRALMLARTKAVALVDVDFLVGGSLSPWLRPRPGGSAVQPAAGATGKDAGAGGAAGAATGSLAAGAPAPGPECSPPASKDTAWLGDVLVAAALEGQSWLEAVLAQNAAVVLPAFQVNASNWAAWGADISGSDGSRWEAEPGLGLAMSAAAADKAGAAELVAAGALSGFQLDAYPQGHKATRFLWWLRTQEPYALDYWAGFEPFLLMPTALTPLYDERFRCGSLAAAE